MEEKTIRILYPKNDKKENDKKENDKKENDKKENDKRKITPYNIYVNSF